MSCPLRRHAVCLSLLLLTCALIEPPRARSQVVDSLRVTVTASAPTPPVARLKETVTVSLAATVTPPPGATPVPSTGPYSSTPPPPVIQGPVWTWKVKSARYRPREGAWQDAPPGTHPSSIAAADTTSGTAVARVRCLLPGTWKFAVTATAKYFIPGGQTWSGTNEANFVFAVAPPGLSVIAEDFPVCAGGKPDAFHQSLITATVSAAGGGAQANVMLSLSTTDGTLAKAVGKTDFEGRLRTTLTSGAWGGDPSSVPPIKYMVTVTARSIGYLPGRAQVDVRAPTYEMFASPINLASGKVASLRVRALLDIRPNPTPVTLSHFPIDNHAIQWWISRILDPAGKVVYAGKGPVPAGYGKIQKTEKLTDSDGNCRAQFVAGAKSGTVEIEASDKDVKLKPKGTHPALVRAVNVGLEVAEIVPDVKQAGVTGDVVPSYRGKEGEKHYVSPKENGSAVVLTAKVAPGVVFANVFEWDGGVPVPGGRADQIQVPRDATGKFVVKVKRKGSKAVVDTTNVWVVWAVWIGTKKVVNIKIEQLPMLKPRVGPKQPGLTVHSYWIFRVMLEPMGIVDVNADIPALRGKNTRDVPGANKRHVATGELLEGGARTRWDMSRQLRIRNLFPTVATDDCVAVPGTVFDNLPNANLIAEKYPGNDAEGNDDVRSPGGADNDPYSHVQVFWRPKGVPPPRNPIGFMSSVDGPHAPSFIHAAGKNGDKLEHRVQFREFVRLQIGDSPAPGYKNWYRISNFYLWRHHAKLKKVNLRWVDDGSVSDPTNNGW